MANRETMSYLTAPLREVAQHHLKPEETVLTAIYAHPTVHLARGEWLWFAVYRQIHHPARAFVLTPERALILEDPTDPAASTADSEYLFASCSLNRVMLFELRSHLLDCALTLVMATPKRSQARHHRIQRRQRECVPRGSRVHARAGRRPATSSFRTARRDLHAGACDRAEGLACSSGPARDEAGKRCHAVPGRQ